jgi:uncharacterized protein YjiS (DUF1127 family)
MEDIVMKSDIEGVQGLAGNLGLGYLLVPIRKLLARVRQWRQLSYERKLLTTLDSRMLRDIGISRADAELESARPFWDDRGIVPRQNSRS